VSAGPLVVAITAPLFGRLAGRIGQRKLLVPGGAVWAAGGLLLLARVTTTPQYATHYLPAVLLTGLGVSLCLPQLSSVSVQGLPHDSFGSGSAVNQAVRNLGGTLGVSLAIAFTTDPTVSSVLGGFHRVWWLLVASGASVSALSLMLPRGLSTSPSAAVPVAAE
jgi:MFS family permease